MPRLLIALPIAFAATTAAADCAPRLDPWLKCKIEGNQKVLEVCFDGNEASYSFGPAGGPPELSLRMFRSEGVTYYPWQGVGREIAEGLDFQNGFYTYATYGGFDRLTAAGETVVSHFGGVRVYQGEQVIATLTCIPKTVEWAY